MVVHFNRLKYCPENVWESPHQQPKATSSTTNQPLPPGTNLQLIDYDESENENIHPQQIIHNCKYLTITHVETEDLLTITMITSRIRDGFLLGEELCGMTLPAVCMS